MGIIAKFMSGVAEPQFRLARDLIAIALADGEITPEEEMAIAKICQIEGIDKARLYDTFRNGYDNVCEDMPQSRKEKANYLRNIIQLIGADGYVAPEEVYLFQIIAGKMGLNQMDVVGLFLLTATRQYFRGDTGAKVLASFLRNYIDPRNKTEKDNRESLRTIYDTVASNTPTRQGEQIDRERLCQNLSRATEAFMENIILVNEFAAIGIDFAVMVREEEQRIRQKYIF